MVKWLQRALLSAFNKYLPAPGDGLLSGLILGLMSVVSMPKSSTNPNSGRGSLPPVELFDWSIWLMNWSLPNPSRMFSFFGFRLSAKPPIWFFVWAETTGLGSLFLFCSLHIMQVIMNHANPRLNRRFMRRALSKMWREWEWLDRVFGLGRVKWELTLMLLNCLLLSPLRCFVILFLALFRFQFCCSIFFRFVVIISERFSRMKAKMNFLDFCVFVRPNRKRRRMFRASPQSNKNHWACLMVDISLSPIGDWITFSRSSTSCCTSRSDWLLKSSAIAQRLSSRSPPL